MSARARTRPFSASTQGLEEANLQGGFLGQRYLLDVERDARLPPAAILAAIEDEALVALAGQHPGTPVFNLSSETDALRDKCLMNLLHVIPSREMKRDALAQWRKLHPGSKALAQAWHPEFKKYSAEQLSKRFFKARGQAMDDGAWAGWAAVKLLSDSVARLGAAEPESLLGYIRTQLAFDGRKGIDMNFRPTASYGNRCSSWKAARSPARRRSRVWWISKISTASGAAPARNRTVNNHRRARS